MSDARDALAEAMALTKKLAAGRLVRRDELEEELTRLESAGGSAERIAAVKTELATVKGELASAIAEIKELERLAGLERVRPGQVVTGEIESDPLIRSAEEIALDNVREHAKELDARVKLAKELGEISDETPEPPPSREDAEAKARAEFEERRAKSKKTL
jgi:hypothetical protein